MEICSFILASVYIPPQVHVHVSSVLQKLADLITDTEQQQFPDRQAAASEAGKIHMQHPYDQHRSSSGLCSLPTALLPVHE